MTFVYSEMQLMIVSGCNKDYIYLILSELHTHKVNMV